MTNKILEKVCEVVEDKLKKDRSGVFRSSRLVEDLGCAHPVLIVSAVEQEFNVEIWDEELEKCKTIEHLATLVEQKITDSDRRGDFE